MHGLTCSRDPRARLACRPPRAPRARGSSGCIWVVVTAGRLCKRELYDEMYKKKKMKCGDLDKVRKKKKNFFFLIPD